MSRRLVAAMFLLGVLSPGTTTQTPRISNCTSEILYDSPEGLMRIVPGEKASRAFTPQLFAAETGASKPHLSPDGLMLAWVRYLPDAGEDPHVWLADLNDERLRPLVPHMLSDQPAWSPDGDWIAFASSRADETSMRSFNYDIYVMRPDGRDVRRITYHPSLALRASWSPLGDELVYQVGGSAEDGSDWDIYSIRVAGGQPRRLTHNSIPDAHPDWNTFQLACRQR